MITMAPLLSLLKKRTEQKEKKQLLGHVIMKVCWYTTFLFFSGNSKRQVKLGPWAARYKNGKMHSLRILCLLAYLF
jgi:hypothetical protein